VIGYGHSQTAKEDFVPHFPWWGAYNNFQAYSGMLKIANASMHYVFVTSQQNKSTDPVVLWLNGGPGCSSMLGLISENGPFSIPDGSNNFTQSENPWSWNRVANVLYL
jgi:carboxypeptidase C (cathepsin A)